jgi:hypothetical protein
MRSLAAAASVVVVTTVASSAAGDYRAVDLYTLNPPPGFDYVNHYGAQVANNGAAVGEADRDEPPTLTHPIFWNSSGMPIDFNPPNGAQAALVATDGVQQVGFVTTAKAEHAFLWNGTPTSGVDLHPPGFMGSVAYGTTRGQQVGAGGTADGAVHALLWTGSASSAVDLNPDGSRYSWARGTDGVHQVGDMMVSGSPHALLWNGTSASAVDLHPTSLQFTNSTAIGVSANEQVGTGLSALGWYHALVWRGTPESAVDLNPPGATLSTAWATNGTQQVGQALYPGIPLQAVVWSGTAESVVNLNPFLPSGWMEADAYAIDAKGNVFGIATDASYHEHVIEWQNVPEPATLGLIGVSMVLRRRNR